MTGFLAVLLIIAGLVALMLSRAARERSGLPGGEVIYSDTRAWGKVDRPLFSSAYRLTGKPDYLVKDRRKIVPVEVKSARAPANGPRAAHIMQLAAYCLLVEETRGKRPDYGIIKYADKMFSVENTAQLRSSLLDLLDEMRESLSAGEVARSHSDPGRCAGCGYGHACDERLI